MSARMEKVREVLAAYDPMGPDEASLCNAAVAEVEEWEARADRLAEAAMALYERVEMDESVGICLSSRVEALLLGEALRAVLADVPSQGGGSSPTPTTRDNVGPQEHQATSSEPPQ